MVVVPLIASVVPLPRSSSSSRAVEIKGVPSHDGAEQQLSKVRSVARVKAQHVVRLEEESFELLGAVHQPRRHVGILEFEDDLLRDSFGGGIAAVFPDGNGVLGGRSSAEQQHGDRQ